MNELPLTISRKTSFSISKQATRYEGDKLKKEQAQELLKQKTAELSDLQELLFADGRWSVLIIMQGMDGSGKDSCIKRIFSGVNPQGCHVVSFKAPTNEDLRHDYLWRCVKQLPEQGKIGIFNRSYYEEVMVVRAYPEILKAQMLPKEHVGKQIWSNRMEDIKNFEQYLSRNGCKIIKFYLNISKQEQAKRLLERAKDPHKYWKVGEHDLQINKDFRKFNNEINAMIENTSSAYAPWHIIPADQKWYAQLLMMNVILKELKSLKLAFPKATSAQLKAISDAKKVLKK